MHTGAIIRFINFLNEIGFSRGLPRRKAGSYSSLTCTWRKTTATALPTTRNSNITAILKNSRERRHSPDHRHSEEPLHLTVGSSRSTSQPPRRAAPATTPCCRPSRPRGRRRRRRARLRVRVRLPPRCSPRRSGTSCGPRRSWARRTVFGGRRTASCACHRHR